MLGWLRVEVRGGEVVMSGSAKFSPLRLTYVPAGFQGIQTSAKVSGEAASIELTFQNADQFVAITQTEAPAERTLPAGQAITVNGQPGVLVTGLEGTTKVPVPEGAQLEAVGTPIAPIAYTDGKRLTWCVGDVKIEMLSNLPVEEMLKIAESLVPAEAGEGEPSFHQPPLDLPSGDETEGGGIITREGPIVSNP